MKTTTSELQPPTNFLASITEKIVASRRLTQEDALYLFACEEPDQIEYIRTLADFERMRRVGNVVLYASTLYIHPTNLCELNCPLCSFYAKPGWEKAWFLTPSQIEEKILEHRRKESYQLNEIHVVGGLWRDCNLDYYQDMFTRIKKIDPQLHIKALTPVEYDFLAKLHGISVEEVFRRMMSWGLDSLPGGGAEILVEEIRQKIAPGKISVNEYLDIHALAHRLGLSSNITMLFGHIESYGDIVTHLHRVRALQDETGGFKTFIPLKFGEENNALGKRKKQLKQKNLNLIYAISRLFLDNINHIKVLWNYVGVQEALEVLRWGADDFSSTNTDEKIITMAGGIRIKMDPQTMEELITGIGRLPRLTHSGELVCV